MEFHSHCGFLWATPTEASDFLLHKTGSVKNRGKRQWLGDNDNEQYQYILSQCGTKKGAFFTHWGYVPSC